MQCALRRGDVCVCEPSLSLTSHDVLAARPHTDHHQEQAHGTSHDQTRLHHPRRPHGLSSWCRLAKAQGRGSRGTAGRCRRLCLGRAASRTRWVVGVAAAPLEPAPAPRRSLPVRGKGRERERVSACGCCPLDAACGCCPLDAACLLACYCSCTYLAHTQSVRLPNQYQQPMIIPFIGRRILIDHKDLGRGR